MMRISTCLLCICLLFTVNACKKKVTKTNSDFVGDWSGAKSDSQYNLLIESNSKGVFHTYKGNVTKEVKGNVRLSGSTLKVFIKKFHVDEVPRQDADNPLKYVMVLDGITFTCWK